MEIHRQAPSDLNHFVIKMENYINYNGQYCNDSNQVLITTFTEKPKRNSTYFEVHAVDKAGNVRASNRLGIFARY